MKTTTIIITVLVLAIATPFFTSCSDKKGCTDPVALNFDKKADKDDGSCIYPAETPVPHGDHSHLSFKFTHDFDGTPVTSANFNTIQYTNANGDQMSISKLRYLISNLRVHRGAPHNDSIIIPGYKLVDLTVAGSDLYAPSNSIDQADILGISFTIGFVPADNISNLYTDLNLATWNWPTSLGGGYHYLQLEGQFINTSSATVNYGLHMGTAREITVTNDTIYHPNYGTANMTSPFTLVKNVVEIEIKMNIAEWFKNPNTWDLNQYNSTLMSNYNAQILMQQNSGSVFSIGTVTQSDH